MEFREYNSNENYVSFFSNAVTPYYKLSNFAYISRGITYKGLTYYSVEHAYQAQKYIPEQRERFSIEGDLGNLKGFELVFERDCEKILDEKR